MKSRCSDEYLRYQVLLEATSTTRLTLRRCHGCVRTGSFVLNCHPFYLQYFMSLSILRDDFQCVFHKLRHEALFFFIFFKLRFRCFIVTLILHPPFFFFFSPFHCHFVRLVWIVVQASSRPVIFLPVRW